MPASPFPILLQIKVGETKPTGNAPPELMEALVSAEVHQSDTIPRGFQLVFDSVLDPATDKFTLIDHANLKTYTRMALTVILGHKPTVLIDGYITTTELDPKKEKLTVTGEDLSVKLSQNELVDEYPEQKDSVIVKTILDRYSALGLTPKVKAPDNEWAPTARTPTQRCSDLDYLLRLAQKNDAQFLILPGKQPGNNTAYWGPPMRDQPPQPAIWPRSSPVFGNLEEVSMNKDGLKAQLTYGEKMADGGDGKESKMAKFSATDLEDKKLAKDTPALSKDAALAKDPKKARDKALRLVTGGKFINQLGINPTNADLTAQARTDQSTGEGVTLTGTLDTVNYGAVMQAPGVVGLRGVGNAMSGDYYVKQVMHSFRFREPKMGYTQNFVLVRAGLGSMKGTVE